MNIWMIKIIKLFCLESGASWEAKVEMELASEEGLKRIGGNK